VAASSQRVWTSIVFELINDVNVVTLTGLLYVVFNPYNRSLVLVGTLVRVAEGIAVALRKLNSLVLLDVSQEYASATGTRAVTLESMGCFLISAEQWSLKIAVALFSTTGPGTMNVNDRE
jgi:hypothetical protein